MPYAVPILGGGSFTGRAFYDTGVFDGAAEDVSDLIGMISPFETPLLAVLGDPDMPAENVFHEWLEDALSPNSIITGTAIPSATADVAVGVAGGLAKFLQVGALLTGPDDAGNEYFQIVSIAGDTITVSRAFAGTSATSLGVGAALSVVTDVTGEGADVTADTSRPRTRKNNVTMIVKKDVIVSGTVRSVRMLGGITDEFDYRVQKMTREALRDLNKAVIRSRRQTTTTLGSASSTRTMGGLLQLLQTNVISIGTLTAAALTQAIKPAWDQGGTDINLIVAGDVVKNQIDGFNQTRQQAMQGSGAENIYSDKVSVFECTYGTVPVLLDRWMPAKRFMVLATSRIQVKPLRGRSMHFEPVAKTGDATKGMIIGEYTLEVKNEEGMVQGKIA